MARSGKKKPPGFCYAVRRGWNGPGIFDTWDETDPQVNKFPGASHKGLPSRAAAVKWIQEEIPDFDPLRPVPTVKREIDAIAETDGNIGPVALPEYFLAPSISETVPAEEVKLSTDQKRVFARVRQGKSVFFTGSAGTGKSVLLREIMTWCREKQREIAVTASTGIAAANIGGMTLHSWAGIGEGKETAQSLVAKIRCRASADEDVIEASFEDDLPTNQPPPAAERWRRCDVLLIDEISMIPKELFDKLEYIARHVRENEEPFGGIQLVICGDFLQLPPVTKASEDKAEEKTVMDMLRPAVGPAKTKQPDTLQCPRRPPPDFAFDATTWERCLGRPLVLKYVFRQRDEAFIDMLNSLRIGRFTPNMQRMMTLLKRPLRETDGVEIVDLFPLRAQAAKVNNGRLEQLAGKPIKYVAKDTRGLYEDGSEIKHKEGKNPLDELNAERCVCLKLGARVMLTKNLVQGVLVNGTPGTVISFQTSLEALSPVPGRPEIHLGYIRHSPKPSPLMDRAERKAAEKRLLDEMRHVTHSPRKWPVVRFRPRGREPIDVICVNNVFELTDAFGNVIAVRRQIPLMLAWALTIHKSQGQTLEYVRVDLAGTFDYGQVYVALSRATSMDGLEVRNFNPERVYTAERAVRWTMDAASM